MNLNGIKELSIGNIKLHELLINDRKIWQASKLPAGYTELKYIEATGAQYIDTGITGHDGISIDFNFTPVRVFDADSSTIVGCTNSSSQRMYVTVNKTPTPDFYWEIGAGSYAVATGQKYVVNSKYHVNVNWTKANSVLTINDKLVASVKNTYTFDDNGSNMYIFARNKGTSVDKYSHALLYDMKIWDNGVLVRNYVPAMYKDGTIGLYDLVSKSFFTNSGDGKFTTDDDIIPSEYTEVDYIMAGRNVQAYIDLGFAFDTKARIEMSAYFSSDINAYLFGAAENNGALRCMISAPYGLGVYAYGSTGSAYNSSGNDSPAYVLNEFNDINAVWEKGNLYIENLTTNASATNTTQAEYTMQSNLYLFAQNYNGSPRFQATGDAVRQIKFFRYYDKNDVLICDLIPCVRNSDSVAGMYDMVTHNFYTNTTDSAAFTAGNAV